MSEMEGEGRDTMAAPLQRSRLGRGLASLIGEPSAAAPRLPPEGEHRIVSVDQVRGGKLNPRRDFREEDLAELAESIRQKGLVQPILVRPDPVGGYEIVAGERRWRAAQLAGLHTVPVIVRDLADQEVLELALIENVQRADLNAIEEAIGYNELMRRAMELVLQYGRPLEIFLVVGILYFIICFPISKFSEWLERRLARNGA